MNAMKSLKAVAAAVVATFGFAAGTANALYLYPTASLEDDDREYLLDAAGNVKTSGAIVVGDRLRATIEIKTISDDLGIVADQNLGVGGEPELTGLSEIQVLAIVPNGVNFDIVFGPSAQFAADIAAITPSGTDVAADYAGAMVALWTDGTPDLTLADQTTSCPSRTTCEGNATNGNLWAVAGFGTDVDRFWVARNVDAAVVANIGALTSINANTSVATYNFAIEVLVNNTGFDFQPQTTLPGCGPAQGCVGDQQADIIGSGQVLGGIGLTNGYIGRSDFDFGVNAIPEPGSLALLAAVVGGFGFAARRRESRA